MPRRNILYKRVYHSLCTRIFSGQFKPGEKLPSMLDLADEFRVSIITIRSTFRLLQELGLIRVSRGKEAVVIYDQNNGRSKERLCQWIKNREATVIEVFRLGAAIIPNTLAFGASLAGPDDLAKLRSIVDRLQEQEDNPGLFCLARVEFYSSLSFLTRNEAFDKLISACDAFTSMTMIAASQSEAFRVDYCACLRAYLSDMLCHIENGRWEQVAAAARKNILQSAARTEEYMRVMTAGFSVTENIPLEWSLYNDLNLHSEIANDLILRISTGEFFDGDRLPSEQKLQEEYRTSSKTIRRAIFALNEQGIVKTLNGIGTVVTFLSLDDQSAPSNGDLAEYTRYFNALQLILLNTTFICSHGFLSLTDEQIETADRRIYRLLSSPNKEFYSYVGILLDVAIQDCPYALTQQILRQFNTCIFLSCHRRKFAAELFRNAQETALPHVFDALECLRRRDSSGFCKDITAILEMLYHASIDMCRVYHLPIESPCPNLDPRPRQETVLL